MPKLPDRRLLLGRAAGAGDPTRWVLAAAEQSVLVLGPPRSGKTVGVVVPNVLLAAGPVVSTSTKQDVMERTAPERATIGRCWLYDPTGQTIDRAGTIPLRWSAVDASAVWDSAVETAGAMVQAAHRRRGTVDQGHWEERAQALLAPLMHASALAGRSMRTVLTWTNRRESSDALRYLETAGSQLALDTLTSVLATEDRELSGIWSTAAGTLAAYRTEAALATTDNVNFDPELFVRSSDTLYVCAPGREQTSVAPLVAGLIDRIVRERYRLDRTWSGNQPPALVLALDEVANIAPLAHLPSIVSEGGGQGVVTLACFQDLSQAELRWGPTARGFLTLFGAKVVLPGIGDRATLEAVSALVGDHDVRVRGTTHSGRGPASVSWSTRRQRIVPPDAVRRAPIGSALVLESNQPAAWLELARPAPAVELGPPDVANQQHNRSFTAPERGFGR